MLVELAGRARGRKLSVFMARIGRSVIGGMLKRLDRACVPDPCSSHDGYASSTACITDSAHHACSRV